MWTRRRWNPLALPTASLGQLGRSRRTYGTYFRKVGILIDRQTIDKVVSSSGHGLVQTGWLFRGVRLSNMLSLEGQLAGIPAANPTTRVLLSVGRHTCNCQLAGLPAAVLSPGMSRLWLLDTKPMDELSRLRRCALSVRSPCRHEDAYSYENLQARVS